MGRGERGFQLPVVVSQWLSKVCQKRGIYRPIDQRFIWNSPVRLRLRRALLFYYTTLMITQSKLVPNSPRCSGGILAGLPVIVVVRKRIGMLKFTIVATVDDDSSIVSISRRVRWMLIPTVDQLTVFPLVIRWYSTVFCLWWGTIISAQCSLIE